MKSVSAHDLTSIHEVVTRYYVQLCDIYSWYAGVCDSPLCAIGLNSFLDLIKDSKLEDCREAAEIAFISSNYEGQEQGRKVNNMDNPGISVLDLYIARQNCNRNARPRDATVRDDTSTYSHCSLQVPIKQRGASCFEH